MGSRRVKNPVTFEKEPFECEYPFVVDILPYFGDPFVVLTDCSRSNSYSTLPSTPLMRLSFCWITR